LKLCLQSVEAATLNIDSEIIVIDNNSSDDSCDMVRHYFKNVKLLQNNTNLGFSRANNLAVNSANGEYLCILNPDTIVAEDCFEKLLNFAAKKTNLGIVGCRLIDGNGTYLPESKRNIPTTRMVIKKMFGLPNDYHADQLGMYTTAKVSILVGAFMFLKRQAFHAIGGFDEDYFMYGEDIDFSYKALKLGLDNYYFGETTVVHFKGESTIKNKTYLKRFYGAMKIFYKKHFYSNILVDILAFVGIQIVFLFGTRKKIKKLLINQTILISNAPNLKICNSQGETATFLNKVSQLRAGTIYVIDINILSFSNLIKILDLPKSGSVKFRILPKKSNFIIGSDDSNNRGEVLHL
jgi:GT2 family glycosyltransferase